MRRIAAIALAGALAAAVSCAPRLVPLPVVTTPKFPDFVRPPVPTAFAGTGAAAVHNRAWTFLQAGDLRNAEREMQLAARADQRFFPAVALGGYLDLAREEYERALAQFDRVLERAPDYASALAGRGLALAQLERELEAAASLEAALAADPSLTDLRRHVDVLRFRGLQRQLDIAREAARGGRHDEAVRAYAAAIEMSPESAVLYREMAASERQRGNVDNALDLIRKAIALEPGDAGSQVALAELLEARNDLEGALTAYTEAVALGAEPDIAARRDALRARIDLARLPDEFRAIQTAAQITRADLAALLGVHLGPVLKALPLRNTAVITDLRGQWAEPWILTATATGVMDTFANHTFQPRSIVRRADLAQVVMRVLEAAAPASRVLAWRAARTPVPDVPAGHVAYDAVSTTLASGVLRLTAAGTFQPAAAVTGAEAVEVIDRLRALLR